MAFRWYALGDLASSLNKISKQSGMRVFSGKKLKAILFGRSASAS